MIHPYILLFGISGGEILILLLLVLLLFGPGKIPEMARMVGRGMREVKKVQREINTEIHRYSSDIEKEAREMRSEIEGKPGGIHGNKKGGVASEQGSPASEQGSAVSDPGGASSEEEGEDLRKGSIGDHQAGDKSNQEDQTDQAEGMDKEVRQPDTPADNEDDDLPYPYGKKKENDSLNHS